MVYGLFILQTDNLFLPVDLTRFESQKLKEGIEVSWQAENEEVLKHYELQRITGNQVQVLSTISKEEFHKNRGSYIFLDKHPLEGVNYYRLKTIDLDGTETLSGIISQRWSHEFNGAYRVYPTILSSQIQPEINIETQSQHVGLTAISLIDMNGKTIFKEKKILEEGLPNVINLPMILPAGTYFLGLQKDGSLDRDQYRVMVK